MHAALNINEVLREIILHISANTRRKRDVYHAALVCKQFSPHALDALWYSIDTLRHLIALIPHTSTETSLLAFTGTTLPTKEDLSHFDLHALRVYELELAPTHAIRVPVMMQLLDCLGRQSLLPKLRYLRLGTDITTDLNEADCFLLCPNLRRLEIRCSDLTYFFPRIIQVVPFLQHLDLPDQAIPTQLIPLTRNLSRLETLQTRNEFSISPDSLFPFPEHLKKWRASSVVLGTGLVNSTQFTALTTLEFTEPIPADDIARLFLQSIFPKLLNFTFVAPSYDESYGDAAQFKSSWLNLCAVLFNNHLKFIHILDDDQELYTDEIKMDLADFFVGIKQQTTLRTFWLGEPKLLKPLTRASIDSMCGAFPFLTDLYIQLQAQALVSFDDLAVLAEQLPLLYRLEIGIDGENLTNPPSVPILSHNLGQLGIEIPSLAIRFCLRVTLTGCSRLLKFSTSILRRKTKNRSSPLTNLREAVARTRSYGVYKNGWGGDRRRDEEGCSSGGSHYMQNSR